MRPISQRHIPLTRMVELIIITIILLCVTVAAITHAATKESNTTTPIELFEARDTISRITRERDAAREDTASMKHELSLLRMQVGHSKEMARIDSERIKVLTEMVQEHEASEKSTYAIAYDLREQLAEAGAQASHWRYKHDLLANKPSGVREQLEEARFRLQREVEVAESDALPVGHPHYEGTDHELEAAKVLLSQLDSYLQQH